MMLEDPRLAALFTQIDRILLILERPLVQYQLLAFAMVVIVTWLIAEIVHRLIERRMAARPAQPDPTSWRGYSTRLLLALEHLFFPLAGILLGQLVVGYFKENGMLYSLLESWLALFWLLFGYRMIVSIFYTVMARDQAHLYHRRLLVPSFVVFVILVLNRSIIGTFAVGDLELFTLLGTPLTLGKLFMAVVVLYLFLVFAGISQDVLQHILLLRKGANPGTTNTVLTISRYSIIGIGILTTLSIVGVDLSTLAIIGGGLSVGIGFGMQDLFANFFSGILLLFDQTLRPGDVIEIAGQKGVVDKMRIRSTVIRTPNNVEVYVPNKTLLTSAVQAHTYAIKPKPPSQVRETLEISVAYNSDLEQVRSVLAEAAQAHELVLAAPAPTVYLTRFGRESIEFELGVWVRNPESSRQVISDLGFAIWKAFQQYGIQLQSSKTEHNGVTVG